MAEFGDEIMENAPLLQPRHMLESKIFELCAETLEETSNLIQNLFSKDDYDQVYKLIIYASKIRPFIWRLLGDLWEKLGPTEIRVTTAPFTEYLYRRKIITIDSLTNRPRLPYSIEEFEIGFPPNSIEAAIKFDDLERITELSTTRDISADLKLYRETVHPLDFVAFFGSKKIFQYLLLNGSKIGDNTAKFAVKGGNFEIIESVLQNGNKISGLLAIAIEYHRNDVVNWLLDNCIEENISLQHCITYYNTLAFTYFFVNKCGVNDEVNDYSPLLTAAEGGKGDIVRFLISNGADCNYKNQYGDSPFTRAATNCHFGVLKQLIEAGVDVNTKYADGTPVISRAATDGVIKLVKFLLSEGVDIKTLNKEKSSLLMLASSSGHLDLVQYLIDNGADLYWQNKYNYTALVWASENDFPDVVDLILEKGDLKRMNPKLAFNKARSQLCREALLKAAEKNNLILETEENE